MKPYYQDDAVTLYCGDCREILPQLGRFDLLLTDPPYGIMKRFVKQEKPESKNRTKFHSRFNDPCDWDEKPPSSEEFAEMFSLTENQVVFGANYFTYGLPVSRGWVFWDKQGDGMSSVNNELIFTSRDRSITTFSRCHGLDKGFMNKDGAFHPTQKPTALLRFCLSLFPDAKTVVDAYAGSGTTGVAAKLEGRKATLIELDERYCEIAAKRLEQQVFEFGD
jgi:DNA modification methylase